MNILLKNSNEILLIRMIKKKIKNEQVVDFLKHNPNFFIENPSILSEINFPSKHNDINNHDLKIIPFKDWIIKNLKNVQKDIIENARHNFFTQKKIHDSIINILKFKTLDEILQYISEQLPQTFDLEIINIVTGNESLSKKYNLIFMDKKKLSEIYGKKNQLIMDAVDKDLKIFDKSEKKIYSNAIFSLNSSLFSDPSLLVFGSKDKHFLDNKAFDLIFFFSKVVQEKLNQLENE